MQLQITLVQVRDTLNITIDELRNGKLIRSIGSVEFYDAQVEPQAIALTLGEATQFAIERHLNENP